MNIGKILNMDSHKMDDNLKQILLIGILAFIFIGSGGINSIMKAGNAYSSYNGFGFGGTNMGQNPEQGNGNNPMPGNYQNTANMPNGQDYSRKRKHKHHRHRESKDGGDINNMPGQSAIENDSDQNKENMNPSEALYTVK
ncbi:MAG: hypothetical protein QME45_07680 [Clostridiales bacterium]|nr:hypothetical protein [Clostridiales bacterium]